MGYLNPKPLGTLLGSLLETPRFWQWVYYTQMFYPSYILGFSLPIQVRVLTTCLKILGTYNLKKLLDRP